MTDQKQQETANPQELSDKEFRGETKFMSKNMFHVKLYAWENNRHWVPSQEVIDAAKCVKRCLERMGLKYE
jgi:hypothetical protein